ncbi:hydrogenase expression/formation protein [Oceanospirillum sediminis]|nr:hydrogenase expression/formation protein [Oceanospirillum sediminis]
MMFDGQIPAFNMPMGPGSQDESEDGEVLNYMPMPKEMASYDMPVLPDEAEVSDLPELRQLLDTLLIHLRQFEQNGESQQLDLKQWPKKSTELLSQILGEGEVSILVDQGQLAQRMGAQNAVCEPDSMSEQDVVSKWQIQETVLAGVWRIQSLNAQGEMLVDMIEVASIPQQVISTAFDSAELPDLNTWFNDKPVDVMNAPMVLIELRDQAARVIDEGTDKQKFPHVVNLSLLPVSPRDLDYIQQMLGVGPVTILSRGYGNCRITATHLPNTWWVQYYNSGDQLILNTVEVCAIPEVALAAKEDIEDSIERLIEIQQAYQAEPEED